MSNLESIVPPVAMCKLIPAGEFVDSALVWMYEDVVGFLRRTSGCEQIHKKEWQLTRNHPRRIAMRRKCGQEIYPAPTLEEVLEAIGKIENWDTATITRPIGVNARIVDTALKRWFEVKGINLE